MKSKKIEGKPSGLGDTTRLSNTKWIQDHISSIMIGQNHQHRSKVLAKSQTLPKIHDKIRLFDILYWFIKI